MTYNECVKNVGVLEKAEKSEYFQTRLTDAEKEAISRRGEKRGVEKGIEALVRRLQGFKIPPEQIKVSVIEDFDMTKEQAEEYYRRFSS